jgi:glutamine amidotransferase-like uncharacterized protein
MRSWLKYSDQHLKVACLTGHRLAARALLEELHSTFGGNNVFTLRPHHLKPDILRDYDLLVLPGIVGEDSPYPDIFTPHRAAHLKQALQNGLIIWAECAPTYYMFGHFEYLARDGGLKTKPGLGLIEGKAIGPAYKHLTRGSGTLTHRLSDIVLAGLSYEGEEGGEKIAHIFNINGPVLLPKNASTKIIARYADLEGTPAAGVVQKIGKGMIIGLGFHPGFSAGHLQGKFSNPDEENHRRTLFERAATHDSARKDLLSTLINTVHTHARGVPYAAEPT